MNARRIRSRIAWWLGKLPGTCWADTVSWYLGSRFHPWWKPYRPITEGCRRDAAECGVCYCGSLTDPEGDKAWAAHVADLDARQAAEGGGAQ